MNFFPARRDEILNTLGFTFFLRKGAETCRQDNVMQESLKGTTKDITSEVIATFNAIYHEIIGICKTGTKYYAYEPLKKERFNFAKVLANMGVTRTSPATQPETVTA